MHRDTPSHLACVLILAAAAMAGQKTADVKFDGERAFAHVEKLVSFGRRSSFDAGIKKAREYLAAELEKLGIEVALDEFMAKTPRGRVTMVNVVGTLPGKSDDVILIGSHYDAKFFEDLVFEGANDSGSNTGVLLELARVLKARPPQCSVWFVFFDGEEPVSEGIAKGDGLYGSRHLARQLQASGDLKRLSAVIVLDMVGDSDLNIKRDLNSTKWLTNVIWRTARELGYGEYFLMDTHRIADDHTPFFEAGVDAVEIIDYDYGGPGPGGPYWHTVDDTLDKISDKSLAVVGEVILSSIPAIEAELRKRRK